ncbi:beta-ketoacyl synthase N-terminal-like domain-containing protein [Nocardia crassostreae]|uniref:beta-ketoacyl synthase N-terminal-like domain-containing protein n=1 Tax=Nocardia crassostreae TaxID=53428 RepID=UPI00082AC239|nr:beta-ketoacyl synthase N-terminal-like domain-containing protein [Nocardia crassostreae]
MRLAISGYASRTCLGDAEQTFAAMTRGVLGVAPLWPDRGDAANLGVEYAHQIPDSPKTRRASAWLAEVVAAAAADAGLDTVARRVIVVVGTGLRELASVERWRRDGDPMQVHELHFGAAVRRALPGVTEVLTICNACSAGNHVLAVAADLLTAGAADAAVVAGCDGMTESMLASIGRTAPERTHLVRPFDAHRTGPLLGEGAAAVVLEPGDVVTDPKGWLRSVGLSCDAHHPTAPDVHGMARSMSDAHTRAGIVPADLDLVVMHGTATVLNDVTESTAHREVFGDDADHPLVAGVKGYLGHTSGAASMMSLVVALQAIRYGRVPAIAGLREPIPEAADLSLVTGAAQAADISLAQINGFEFGGVNAVAVIGRGPDTGAGSAVASRPVAVSGYSVHVPGASTEDVCGAAEAAAMVAAAEAKTVLGRKGLLYLEPATLLALCAVQRALGLPDGRRPELPLPCADRTAVVVSSNLGNVDTVTGIVQRVAEESYRAVSPLELPNASSNVIAEAIALRYGFTGPNLMICNGATSGVDAMRIGASLIAADRADRVVVVGVEPADETAAALLSTRPGGADSARLRAAAACVVLGPGGGTGIEVGANGFADAVDAIPAGDDELRMVPAGLGLGAKRRIDLTERLGDAYGALGVLQTAIAAHLLATEGIVGAVITDGDPQDGYGWLRLENRRVRT